MSAGIKVQGAAGLAGQTQTIALILEKELRAVVTIYDGASGDCLTESSNVGSSNPHLSAEELEKSRCQRPFISAVTNNSYAVIIPLVDGSQSRLIAVARVPRLARTDEDTADESHRLERLCAHLAEKICSSFRGSSSSASPRELKACAALTAVDALMKSGMQGDRPGFQRRILKAVIEVLCVETVIWVPTEISENVVIRGKHEVSTFNCRQLARALSPRVEGDETGVLISNDVEQSDLADFLPGVTGLLAIKIRERDANGFLIAINKRVRSTTDKSAATTADESTQQLEAFRRSDAAFLSPFSTLLVAQANSTRRVEELKDLLVGFARSLTAAIDAKDPHTAGHSERVARISVELSKELGLTEAETRDIYLTGLLHDIGKLGVRDEILQKESQLTDEEWAHIAQHPVIGYRILSGLSAIKHLLGGVLYHHERIDGGGYPEGLRGDAIPQNARIIAVADSFDAMVSDRPYRKGMQIEKIHQILRDGAGKQWDPSVVDAFFRCEEQVRRIRQKGVGESLRAALNGAIAPSAPKYEGTFVMPDPGSAFHRES